jgi:hypothetical protein
MALPMVLPRVEAGDLLAARTLVDAGDEKALAVAALEEIDSIADALGAPGEGYDGVGARRRTALGAVDRIDEEEEARKHHDAEGEDAEGGNPGDPRQKGTRRRHRRCTRVPAPAHNYRVRTSHAPYPRTHDIILARNTATRRQQNRSISGASA